MTRPPKYRASPSRTTSRESPTRLQIAGDDLVERCSFGPAISKVPFSSASVTSATMAATSSAAMGWNRPGESLTMFPSALEVAIALRNSRNWVERMMPVRDAGTLSSNSVSSPNGFLVRELLRSTDFHCCLMCACALSVPWKTVERGSRRRLRAVASETTSHRSGNGELL